MLELELELELLAVSASSALPGCYRSMQQRDRGPTSGPE